MTDNNMEKVKRKVNIVCSDGSSLMGFIHMDRNQKLIDFVNDSQRTFIVVNDAEFYYIVQVVYSFKLARRVTPTKKESIILQKSFIEYLVEM
jgi:hypothetical protein